MKHITTISIITLFIGASLSAQNNKVELDQKKDGFGIGYKLGQVNSDFGLGLELSSPALFGGSFALRASGNYFFLEHFSVADAETIWTPYFVGRFGTIGYGGRPLDCLRLYGEGGIVYGIPASEFSTESSFIGGYGLFGFELFMSNTANEFVSYYIELGGTGTGSHADLVGGSPIYHNGFTIGTGLRFYL